MLQTQGALCCAKAGQTGGGCAIGGRNGLGVGIGGKVGSAGLTFGSSSDNRTILQKLSDALDQAIHGGDSGGIGASSSVASGTGYGSGANVIPFPMVSPYRPIGDADIPVSGLFAWPSQRGRIVSVNARPTKSFNARGDEARQSGEPTGESDDEQSSDSFSGFGFLDPGIAGGGGISLPQSGPSTLQTILGTIQATLPATIQAIRAQPSNIYPGNVYNPYSTNYPGATYPGAQAPGANIGAQAGAAVGNVGDTLGNIVAQHPYLVLAGVGAAILLFMQPPRRR